MFRTHYDNLQISKTASDEVIRAAYRALSQKHHPDKNPANREAAERVMKLINEAYTVLSDPALRKEHDSWIAQQLHEELNAQLRSQNLESGSHSNEMAEEKVAQSPLQPAVVKSNQRRVVVTGAVAIAIGLLALMLLGQQVTSKTGDQTIFLVTGMVALLAFAIGIPVLSYAGFVALRKQIKKNGFASWAKPLWETVLGASVVTTCLYFILEWVNRQ